MKIALFGTGKMGRAIAYMIKRLGDHTIYTWDSQEPDFNLFKNLRTDHHTVCKIESLKHIDKEFDLVISSLPYHLNFGLAKLCIQKKIPYCDLGGSVPVSNRINELAAQRKSTVFTDLGLAPGWVNIMAEEIMSQADDKHKPTTINMRCGGLPNQKADKQEDPFNYRLTWSPEGLHNEYVDNCKVLKEGNIISVPALSEREDVVIEGFTDLEAFTTSGGASHTLPSMKERGVKECSYKTLRYKGHLDLLLYFLRKKKFNAKQLADILLEPGLFNKDVVIMNVEALVNPPKKRLQLTFRPPKLVRSEITKVVYSKGAYSAMQRATAGGLVSAIFASPLDGNHPLSYEDVQIEAFNSHTKQLQLLEK